DTPRLGHLPFRERRSRARRSPAESRVGRALPGPGRGPGGEVRQAVQEVALRPGRGDLDSRRGVGERRHHDRLELQLDHDRSGAGEDEEGPAGRGAPRHAARRRGPTGVPPEEMIQRLLLLVLAYFAGAVPTGAGHCFSIFLDFGGGKGVATGAGVFLALAPVPTAVAAGVWGLVVGSTRLSSLGAVLSLPVLVAMLALADFDLAGIAVSTGR